MKKRYLIFLLVLAAGCDSVDSSNPDELLVVEAFLFTGEPVDNVRITEAIPLTSLVEGDTLEVPVNDAVVRLRRGQETYLLTNSEDNGFYRYSGADLVVGVGETFVLEIERAGAVVTATTTVPNPPESVALSSDRIEIIPLVIPIGGPPDRAALQASAESLRNARISVLWDNPASNLHFVVIEELATDDPDFILPDFIRQRVRGFRQVEAPTDEDLYEVDLRSLETFGEYRAIVYRVNEEYADLYSGLSQDSRDLNEPPSNIVGGLGVFSAFAGQEARFQVVAIESN
ncbi:MAG: hypothetical protein ACI9W4_001994 [Rhodothermales bacterium]|jgi:hypothetical protein